MWKLSFKFEKKLKGYIFISHTHWDHIQGFPFFVPFFIPGNTFKIFGPPSDVNKLNIKQIMEFQMKYEYFPIRVGELGAKIEYIDGKVGELNIDGYKIKTEKLNHPVFCLAYKIFYNDKIIIYGGDHEPFRNIYRDDKKAASDMGFDEDYLIEYDKLVNEQNAKIYEFCENADIVIWDSQYSEEEYKTKIGWGHSYYEANIKMAEISKIKHIVFNHHDPASSDEKLSALEEKYSKIAEQKGFKLSFSREGKSIEF